MEIFRGENGEIKKNIVIMAIVLVLLVVGDVLIMTKCSAERSAENLGSWAAEQEPKAEKADMQQPFNKSLAGSSWKTDEGGTLQINNDGTAVEVSADGVKRDCRFEVWAFEDGGTELFGIWKYDNRTEPFHVNLQNGGSITSQAFYYNLTYYYTDDGKIHGH